MENQEPNRITISEDVKTPTFYLKVLKDQKGTRRYQVVCMNRRHIPENPKGNNHHIYFTSFLDLKSYLEMMVEHVEQKIAESEQTPQESSGEKESTETSPTETQEASTPEGTNADTNTTENSKEEPKDTNQEHENPNMVPFKD
jgi:hypothetical protein